MATAREINKLEKLYEGCKVYHGELHDHSASGGTSDGKLPLQEWVKEMAELNMDFAAILDHRQVRHMYLPEWKDGLFIGGSEPGTRISDSKAEVAEMHYNMLFEGPKELEALLALSRRNRTRSRALYYLSGRDYAAKELKRKLSRSSDKETADEVVDRLAEVGLVDDSAYAERLARSFANYRLYPRRRIMGALREKGISREDAETALEKLDTDDLQIALALIRKKYYNKTRDETGREKVAAALARSGFGFDTVRRAMEIVAAECTEES